jgi:hypothetical protein
MIIHSSSSEGSDDDNQLRHGRDVIELSDSRSPKQSLKPDSNDITKGTPVLAPLKIPGRCSDEENSCSDGEAILTL